jgi:hypothetical protein
MSIAFMAHIHTHMQWEGYVARVEEKRNMYKIFIRENASLLGPKREAVGLTAICKPLV